MNDLEKRTYKLVCTREQALGLSIIEVLCGFSL